MIMSTLQRIHCIGIKGIGLSALAQVLAAEGYTVTGSDTPEHFPADEALKAAGIKVFTRFDAKHISGDVDRVIVSNAYLPKESDKRQVTSCKINTEVKAALKRGIPVRSYPEALGEIFNRYRGIAVAGSHGKSTTAALLAVTLEALKADPHAVIGAVVKNWNANARVSAGIQHAASWPSRLNPSRLFVIEADEYRRAFHHYAPTGAIMTSVDWDHPDVYPTEASYRRSFSAFVRRIRPGGFLLVNGDDAHARGAAQSHKRGVRVITYGFNTKSAIRIMRVRHGADGIAVTLRGLGVFRIRLYGEQNAMNVAAVVGVCRELGYPVEAIRRALKTFKGTVRRFDILSPPFDFAQGKQPSPLYPVVIDDYGHHPTEIAATIKAARGAFPKRRIRVLFQPHTFSRTAKYFDAFVAALATADDVALLRTYGSARETKGGKSAQDLARALGVRHFATHAAELRFYRKNLFAKDLLIVMGAGDGDALARKLVE